MYQPRRAGAPAASGASLAQPVRAIAGAPRPASRTWYIAAADRVGAVFLGLAVTATTGALVMAGTAAAAPIAAPVTTPDTASRHNGISRELVRPDIAAEDALAVEAASKVADNPLLQPTKTMYAKKKVTVVEEPKADADKVTSLDAADKITVTPEISGKYRLVKYKSNAAWVLKASLQNSKPTADQLADGKAPAATRKVPSGSVLGLQPEAMIVYRAVMARWAVKNVGGWRAHSLSVHQLGRAIDFMTYGNFSQGNAIAAYVVAHAKEFNVDHVIYRQRIWTPYSPHWRGMANRGSATANHMDHVHVAVKNS